MPSTSPSVPCRTGRARAGGAAVTVEVERKLPMTVADPGRRLYVDEASGVRLPEVCAMTTSGMSGVRREREERMGLTLACDLGSVLGRVLRMLSHAVFVGRVSYVNKG